MIRRALWLLAAAAMLLAGAVRAQGRKPPLPPGLDPGGVAIALLSTGVDYTMPDIAHRLARDGEGQLIGWDFVDNDIRPFNSKSADTPAAWGGDGNALVRGIGRPGRRVVVVRIDTRDPVSLAKAVAFVAQTPARVVVVPMWTRAAGDWEPFAMAAKAFAGLLFIVAAGDEGRDIDREPVWPAALGLANVLVVSAPVAAGSDASTRPNTGAKTVAAIVEGGDGAGPPQDSRQAAVAAADALAGCWPQLLQRLRGEALKGALLAEAAKARPGAATPVIGRCAAGGGAPTKQ
jgi:hypothetical protein